MDMAKLKQHKTTWALLQKKETLQYCACNLRVSLCGLFFYIIKRRTLQHYINNKDNILSFDDKKEEGILIWKTHYICG